MEEINKMFSKIYRQYDFMNHLFSFNYDKGWREEAAKEALIKKDRYTVLDVASGTGDLAIAVDNLARDNGKSINIYAQDFNKDMLEIARRKFKQDGIGNITVEIGNAFKSRHRDNSIDVITSGFALRSFANTEIGIKGLRLFISESYKTLKPGGKIVLLDMAMPDKPSQRAFFRAYSVGMVAIGSAISGPTYAWLVKTIKTFDKKELLRMMKSSRFKNVRIRSLKSGIAFIATGSK